MAEIAWTEEALRWLEDIFEYLATDNPPAAGRTVDEIYERAQLLSTYHEVMEACLKDILAIEGWDLRSLTLPESLKKKSVKSI